MRLEPATFPKPQHFLLPNPSHSYLVPPEISGDLRRRDLRRSPRGIGEDGSHGGASTAGASSDRCRRTCSPTPRPSPRHSLPPHTTSTAAASVSRVRVGLGSASSIASSGSLDDTPNLEIYRDLSYNHKLGGPLTPALGNLT
uniref:Uncharacterized protein n=1 Tax=Ananas comosus var. bracteatus TaxID=296719 RepID=A0A6V7PEC4_ANACO|nr:unnamed protein product [Ananas comosus var. bracteatus]